MSAGAASSSSAAAAWCHSRASGGREGSGVGLDALIAGPPASERQSKQPAVDRAAPAAKAGARKSHLELVLAEQPFRNKNGIQLAEYVVPEPFPMNPIPPKVLSEDDYTDAVSHIIERDFFPDLAHLRLKHELLEARNNGDLELTQELQWQLINLSRPTPLSSVAATPGRLTPGATPMQAAKLSGAATPGGATPRGLSAWERDDDTESVATMPVDLPSNARLQLADGKSVVVDLQKVRLDDFHRVFTSEDNDAFEKIIQSDNERKKFKQWWIEAAEKKHNTQHQQYVAAILNGGELAERQCELGSALTARNTLSFKPRTIAQVGLEKPLVDFKNTRFTTSQQNDLDNALSISAASRQAATYAERKVVAGENMAVYGQFGSAATHEQGGACMRSSNVANRGTISTPTFQQDVRGYPLVSTPSLLPGVGGLSPLMTYGKLGSTPRCLDDYTSFRMNEKSDREVAAEKLQRGATQKVREAKQHTKAERLRALGLTPKGGSTPARTPGAASGRSTGRRTPGSVTSSRVSPLSPIGALIQKAKKMSQQGGRFGISSTPPPTPLEASSSKRRKTSSKSVEADRLPASITDNLL